MGVKNNPEELNSRPLTPPDLIFVENEDFSDDDSQNSDDEITAPGGYALLATDINGALDSSDSEEEEHENEETEEEDSSEKVDVDAVKNAMSKIKLPTLALPDWGQQLTDEDFVAAVRETISAKNETIKKSKSEKNDK
ncbi:unnamed protein product [Oikopleura dioica]|uniref:Male-enhanced antigen 1 n=1 Tax=Oikopleura dioica TaxID=34765 RepID=E4YXA0_OIKDI|nr:unnamed protein product [Oikopleura dioica]